MLISILEWGSYVAIGVGVVLLGIACIQWKIGGNGARWRSTRAIGTVFLICILADLLVANTARAAELPDDPVAVARDRVRAADERCSAVPMPVTTESDWTFEGVSQKARPGPPRIVERPVALCAFKESDASWHVVMLHLAYPVPDAYKSCVKSAATVSERAACELPFHVVTPDYDVEHVGWGYGIARFTADVYETTTHEGFDGKKVTLRGEKLKVYRTRHVWLDDDALASGDTERIIRTSSAVNYTPYHPDLFDPELARAGRQFLFRRAYEGMLALSEQGVPSRAYPGRLLADVVPWEIIFALALIEQTDDLEFNERGGDVWNDRYVEFAHQGRDASRFSQSGKDALGLMQWTRRTYENIVALYPEAALDPVFETGARDMHNAIKAAYCLIDYEIGNFPEIRALFRKEPLLAGIYPVAAYNGGPVRAKELFALMKAGKIKLADAGRVPQSIVRTERHTCKCGKHGKKKTITKHVTITINGETHGYVGKYVHIINEVIPKVGAVDME